MAEETSELDKVYGTNTPLTEIPEPQVILLAPPAPFLPLPSAPAAPWERWLGSFELYLNSLGKANLLDSAKCVLLQHSLGKEGKRVYAKLLPGTTTYKAARAALTTYFSQPRDIQLLKYSPWSVANTELIGKQMDHSSAHSVLQTLDGEHHAHWGPQFYGQSDRIKKQYPSIPTPPRFSGHIEDSYYYSSAGNYYDEEEETKCDSVDTHHVNPKDEDFKIDSNDMDGVDSHELGYSGTAASSITSSLTKDKPFCCPDCPKSFGRIYHLKRHIRDMHGSVTYTCSICKESLRSYKELQRHRERHTKLLSCPICIDRIFIGPSKLTRHMRSHTKEKPFCCPVCGALFSQGYHLKRHLKVQHGNGTFICSVCGESVGSYKELQTHRKGHAKLLSCPICVDRSFIKPSALARHMRSHTKEKPFCCPVCGALFSQGYHLKRHLRVQHGNGTFICSVCGENVGSFKELQAHKKNHAYSFACSKCDQRFPLKSELLSHMQSHSDRLNEEEHLSKDKQCSNGLGTKTSVASDHTRDSEGGSDAPATYGDDKKDYHVEAMEEMDPLVKDGNKHSGGRKEYHGEMKPAKTKARGLFCPICINKSFNGPSKLARHMRTHTKEKPFCCKICSKLFSQDYHLRRHMRVQHREFICSKSGELFSSVEELEKHDSTHGSSKYSCDGMFYRQEAFSCHSVSHSHNDKQAHLDCGKWRQAFIDMDSYDVRIETNDVSK